MAGTTNLFTWKMTPKSAENAKLHRGVFVGSSDHRIHRQLVGTSKTFWWFQFRVSHGSRPHAELKRCSRHPLTVTLFMNICPILRLYQQSFYFYFSFLQGFVNPDFLINIGFQAAPFGSRPERGESLRRRDNERMRSLRRLGNGERGT